MESQLIELERMQPVAQSTNAAFIEANTIDVSFDELAEDCVIPVFAKDNEPTISHIDFINTVHKAAQCFFPEGIVNSPAIRVSHPIKGRIPEARHKKSNELLPHEVTTYYERMMFCIEIPSVRKVFGEEELSLTIGGVRAYNLENLYSRKSLEKFKLFLGFKNRVCCNLCVWSDGSVDDIKVLSTGELSGKVEALLAGFNAVDWIQRFESWRNNWFSERDFAEFIGRCKLYLHKPNDLKSELRKFQFGDYQLSQVVEGYYNDPVFGRDSDGNISQWNLYNLLTGANKSSYIDKFLDRAVNASDVVNNISDYFN